MHRVCTFVPKLPLEKKKKSRSSPGWLRLIIYRRHSGFILNDRKYQDNFSRIRVIKIQTSIRCVFIHSTILFQLIDISCKEIYLDLLFSFVIVSFYFQYRDRVASMSI